MAKIKQKQEDGTEIEVEMFDANEMAEKIEEAKASVVGEYEEKLKEKDTTLSTTMSEIENLKAQLDITKEDNPNFKVLKEALDKKDAIVTKLQEEIGLITSDKEKAKKEEIDAKIAKVANGSEDIAKKIKYNLENVLVGMKEGTPAEREAKFQAAVKLSVDVQQDAPGMFDGGTGDGNRGHNFNNSSNMPEFTAREKALGAKLGITEEDYKKFGPKLTIKRK